MVASLRECKESLPAKANAHSKALVICGTVILLLEEDIVGHASILGTNLVGH